MLLTFFLQRIGLDADEAEEVNELTAIAQMAQSLIQVQTNLRAKNGFH